VAPPIILYVYSSLEEETFILRIDPFPSLPFPDPDRLLTASCEVLLPVQ
jgi:hypothetical protein